MFKAWQMWPGHRVLAISLVAPLFVLMIGWMFLFRSYPGLFNYTWFYAYVLVVSVLMGIWGTFIIFSIPLDVVQLAVFLVRKVSQQAHDPDRRQFISNSFRLSLVGVSAGIGAMGLIQVMSGARVKKISITHSKLPHQLINLTIAQISDLHVGTTIRKGYVNEVVEKTNAINPDLIFITGDLADGTMSDLKEHMAPLANLKSKYGVYYITGNHEYYWGALSQIEVCKSFGFIPLINENRIIDINGSKLMIAGVTDPVAEQMMIEHKPDLAKAIESFEACDFKILLAHRPDTIIEAEPLGFHLQFSGHTHSGQFFPFSLLLPLAHKYYRGLNQHGKAQVYVNSGTGYWGPPNRFAIPSEISHITLS